MSIDFAALRANMLEHPGRVVLFSRGNSCRHRGLEPMDWLQMVYARAARAVVICTADKAFADMCGGGEFGRMQVQLADEAAAGPLYDLARARAEGSRAP